MDLCTRCAPTPLLPDPEFPAPGLWVDSDGDVWLLILDPLLLRVVAPMFWKATESRWQLRRGSENEKLDRNDAEDYKLRPFNGTFTLSNKM